MQYDANNIRRTSGASKHREQTARYLGSTDARGIINQFTEIYDNALDEVIEYHSQLCKHFPNVQIPPLNINVTITPSEEVIIEDEGRGLPCDIHPETNEPAIYLIFEDDSAGGKGNHLQGGYESMTSGMHGAGASVSKSCTDFFMVEARNKAVYTLQYTKGERANQLQMIGNLQPHPNPILQQLGIMYTGTKIYYKYDSTIFSPTIEGTPVAPYDYHTLKTKLISTVAGIPNPNAVIINFTYHNQTEVINPNDYTPDKLLNVPINEVQQIEIKSMVKRPDEKNYFQGTIYFTRNNQKDCTVILNRLLLNQGVIDKSLYQVFSKYIYDNVGQYKDYKYLCQEEEQRYSFVVIMNLVRPEFSGQSKQNLSSSEFIPELKSLLNVGLHNSKIQDYFKPHFESIRSRIIELEEQRRVAKKIEEQRKLTEMNNKRKLEEEKKLIYDENAEKNKSVIDKLEDQIEQEKSNLKYKASRLPKDQCTLVLVEGGSSATVDDIIKNQPIEMLAVDGKVTNVFKNDVTNISKAYGLIRLILSNNYKSVKILTDSDSDGLHIKILLIALIHYYCPNLVQQGKLYVVKSPYSKFVNNTGQVVTIDNKQIYNSEVYYPLSKITHNEAIRNNLTLLTKYGGLADSFADANLNLLDLLNKPEFCEQIILTPDDVSILMDILSTESVSKKMFINNLLSDYYKKSSIYKVIINKLQRFKPDYSVVYSSNPTVKDYYTGL